jgi:hypothetical protein
MVVEQACADDVALESLRNAASALVSLDAAPSREDLDASVQIDADETGLALLVTCRRAD